MKRLSRQEALRRLGLSDHTDDTSNRHSQNRFGGNVTGFTPPPVQIWCDICNRPKPQNQVRLVMRNLRSVNACRACRKLHKLDAID